MIVTILFVGSIPNFGINIIEPRQDVLKVIYFAKDVHQACHNSVQYLSKGLNLLAILKTSIKTKINRMIHIHVLMVSQFGGSGI